MSNAPAKRNPVEELAEGAQAEGVVGQRDVTSPFDGGAGVAVGEVEQPLQHTHALDAARLKHGLGPAQAARTQPAYLTQEPGRAAFNAKRPPDFTGSLRRRGEAWEEPSEEDAKRLDEAYRSGEF